MNYEIENYRVDKNCITYEIDSYKVEIELLIHPICKVKITDGERKVFLGMNLRKTKEEIIEQFLKSTITKEGIMPILESIVEKAKEEFGKAGKDWW